MTIGQLENFAYERGIEIDDFPMREVRAASFPEGWIAIDKRKFSDETEYKCELAHEIGHCETRSFYNIYSRMSLWEINERQANRWAVEALVPVSELKREMRRGILLGKSLAKIFGVTQEIIEIAKEIYESELCMRGY